MLTLSRGGPIVWISEIDAQKKQALKIMIGLKSLMPTGQSPPVRWSANESKKA